MSAEVRSRGGGGRAQRGEEYAHQRARWPTGTFARSAALHMYARLTHCFVCRGQVTAVSKKTNTTRAEALGATTLGDTQLLLYDTPGVRRWHTPHPHTRILHARLGRHCCARGLARRRARSARDVSLASSSHR